MVLYDLSIRISTQIPAGSRFTLLTLSIIYFSGIVVRIQHQSPGEDLHESACGAVKTDDKNGSFSLM